MSLYTDLKAKLDAAEDELERLWGNIILAREKGGRKWKRQRAKAEKELAEALFKLSCLKQSNATAEELREAACLLDSPGDLFYRADGRTTLDESEWNIGDEVEVLAPVRMGNKPGDPMVPYHDAWTGRRGRVLGMTPDGLDLYLSCLEDAETVYKGRVRRV